jgi:hypothetical protein
MAVTMKIAVFWDVRPCRLLDIFEILEERCCPKDAWSMFFRNVGNDVRECSALHHTPVDSNHTLHFSVSRLTVSTNHPRDFF